MDQAIQSMVNMTQTNEYVDEHGNKPMVTYNVK